MRGPPTLSGGEQQRVAIARAVVARPDLLIADEPTGNVDPEMGARLIRLFAELNRLGTTVLIATHDRALIEATRAREMRLVEGRLVELRRPEPAVHERGAMSESRAPISCRATRAPRRWISSSR